MTPLDQIQSDFEFLDEWEDRYRYVIELGRTLPALPEELKTEANKVRGCASQVWLAKSVRPSPNGPVLDYAGDSDAHIVRGLIAILFAVLNGRTAGDILAAEPQKIFGELGLNEHLTPQRSNGLASMVQRIRRDADEALAQA